MPEREPTPDTMAISTFVSARERTLPVGDDMCGESTSSAADERPVTTSLRNGPGNRASACSRPGQQSRYVRVQAAPTNTTLESTAWSRY